MKRCPRCDLNFPDSLKFCESCGGTLAQATTLRCPSCNEVVQPGWKFCAKCQSPLPPKSADLSDARTTGPVSPTIPSTSPPLTFRAPSPDDETITRSQQATVSNQQIRVRCRSCRNLVDEDSTFCEYCGASMTEDTAPLIVQPSPPPPTQRFTSQPTYVRDTVYEAANNGSALRSTSFPSRAPAPTEITTERAAPTLTMLEAYGQTEAAPTFKWWHGLFVALFFFAVFAALGVGGWYWWTHRSSAQPSSAQPSTAAPAQTSASTPALSTTPNQTSLGQAADDELKQLRAWRVSAPPSDANRIVAAIEDAEKKYPTDYRFPYERAKLSIKGMISHHEAFEAISLAGEKAIDNGKAEQMLSDLMSDKDGDFYKMSRGHREWTMLEEALQNKDKRALAAHEK